MKKLDQNKRKRAIQAINFIEELSWLLDSKKTIDFKEVPLILRSLLNSDSSVSLDSKYESPNPNKNYLIGILPNFFQDTDLFRTNVDLSDFAEIALSIPITRPEKRSKYELIGLIVCEITNLDDSDLTNLVNALGELTGNNEKLKKIKEEKKKANFSWNSAIEYLSKM